jgi:hypothetical protein
MKTYSETVEPAQIPAEHSGSVAERIDRDLAPQPDRKQVVTDIGNLPEFTVEALPLEDSSGAAQSRSESGDRRLSSLQNPKGMRERSRPGGRSLEIDHAGRVIEKWAHPGG